MSDSAVRHRGTPVDDPLGAVDQAVVVHPLEDGLHRPGQPRVHGEALARPVHAVAEAAHLAEDPAAGLLLPLPDPLDERLPTEVVPGEALLGQLPLDHVLGGDAGVVHARQPERVVALHAAAAGQRVHQRVLEGMAEVQRAGDVGRRDDDAERRLVGRLRSAGREVAPLDPPLVERPLYLRRNVLAGQVGTGRRPGGGAVGGVCHGHAGMVRRRERAVRTAIHKRGGHPQITGRAGPVPGQPLRSGIGGRSGREHLRWWCSRGPRCWSSQWRWAR